MENKLKAVTILLRATKSMEKVLKNDISTYGLNTTEFGVLEYLYHKGPQPMQNLCKRLLMANSSMTYVIDNLVKNDYVERYSDEVDKRSIYVKLTASGLDYIKEIFPVHEKRIEEVLSVLTDTELISLTEILKKIGYYSEKISKEGKLNK